MFEEDSMYNPTYTFVEYKLSCWAPMYHAHVIFAYFTAAAGLIAMITRIKSSWYKYHYWAGRFYILLMIWTIAVSILVHNEGLPTGALFSFLWCLLGLSFGWLLIMVKARFGKTAGPQTLTAPESFSKVILSRLFSLKSIHGYLMFVSWFNLAGTLFTNPPTSDFACYTIPAFKLINTTNGDYRNQTLTELPRVDPEYLLNPWANSEERWAAALSLGPLFGAVAFALIWITVTEYRKNSAKRSEPLIQQWDEYRMPDVKEGNAEEAVEHLEQHFRSLSDSQAQEFKTYILSKLAR